MKVKSLTDKLALDRTSLANERTFLAYLRSFIVMLSSGVAILKLEILSKLESLGYLLVAIAPFFFIIGFIRYIRIKRRLNQYETIKESTNE